MEEDRQSERVFLWECSAGDESEGAAGSRSIELNKKIVKEVKSSLELNHEKYFSCFLADSVHVHFS